MASANTDSKDTQNMDTINNVAAAASKTIFGDGSDKKEPVSGAKGDVSKGEPYDAGNLDPEDQKRFETLPTPGETPSAKVTDDPVAAATTSDEPAPKGDTTAGQTDPKEKPTETSDHPEEETIEPTGPGPKPVAQLAAEHGGDAGKANEATTAATTTTDDADKDKSDEGDKSKEKPAGETVVHASGLKADGGDFDAANPGAGQEADRLMQEKGISHEGGEKKDTGKPSGPSKSGDSGTPKKSLSDRIKAKFHKKKESSS